MTKLNELYDNCQQSPWIDNLKRSYITSGQLQKLVDQGIRGVTSNPTIFQKAISGSADYDESFRALSEGRTVEEVYWELVINDVVDACGIMRPTYDAAQGTDGFVSLEVSPHVAKDTDATTKMARHFHERIALPNLMVKIPATIESVPSIEQMIREGRNINVTLIFSLERYETVIDAYLAGLEGCEENLANVASVASFFISRVDTETDKRLEAIGTPEALALRGKAAVAQGQLAYQLFLQKFSGPRWEALAARGARVQRPLWASTSTKNPEYPDLLYVDSLIGPDTVNTMPDQTVDAFNDHGVVARTVDADPGAARKVWDDLASVGVDMEDVASTIEREGVDSFSKSFDDLITALSEKGTQIGANV